MAVALDTKMSNGGGTGQPHEEISGNTVISSTGHTVGGSATLLVAVLAAQTSGTFDPAVSAFTWAGGAMTAGPSISALKVGGEWCRAWIYYKVSPTSGAQTLSVTLDRSVDMYLSSASFTGTDTSTGINAGDSVSGTTGSTVTIPSATGDATLAISMRDGDDPTVNFNEIFSTAPFAPGAGASYQLGGTSNAHTFSFGSGTVNAWAGIHILSGGGGNVSRTPVEGVTAFSPSTPGRVLSTVVRPATP